MARHRVQLIPVTPEVNDGISAQRCLTPSLHPRTNNNQPGLTPWAMCAAPPAPQASGSPSAKWDDVIPLLILELSRGSSRTLAQEILEAVKGRGSAKPRPLQHRPCWHLFQEALWIPGKAPF